MTITQLQKKVKELYKTNNWETDNTLLLIAMQEELGEIASRFLAENPHFKKSLKGTAPIDEEIGDLLTLLFAFCNKSNISVEECIIKSINKRKTQGI